MSTTDLYTAMERHHITIDLEYRGIERDKQGWQHHVYSCDMDVSEEMLWHGFPYRAGMALDAPKPADVLAAVLSDASSVVGYDEMPSDDGWIEWASDLGYFADGASTETIRGARDAFRDCRTWLHLLRENVGIDATDELLTIAAEL